MGKKKSKTIAKLNKRHRNEIAFSPATNEVVTGYELQPIHNGGLVSVSQGPSYNPSNNELTSGRSIVVGSKEKLKRGILRCYRRGNAVYVAVFKGQKRLTRELKCRVPARGNRIDEGLFTWFGPREYVGTPWSDNDPEQCQVITVQRLRQWGNS